MRRAKIQFEVRCFDRYLDLEVDKNAKDKAERILDEAYLDWFDLESGECCEEYILEKLDENGIPYIDVSETDTETD